MPGVIIAVEGIDGAGKNTLVTAAEALLKAEGLSVFRMSFPAYGQTLFADLADDALHGKLGDVADSAWAMALLFALDRKQRRQAIVDAAEKFDVVILDRYVASNAAYSWARTGDDAIVQWIKRTEFEQFEMPLPDLQVYLGTSVDVAAQRAQQRELADATRVRDVYETDDTLQQKTAAAYMKLHRMGWCSPWEISDGDAATLAQLISSIRRSS